MHNKGYDRITDKFLDRGNLFGIEFNQGHVFLEVTDWEQTDFSPYSNIGDVAAESNSGFSVPEDPDNTDDEILFVPRGEQKVLHAGIGHEPGILRRYTQYPDGDNTLRKLPNLGSPSARNGDDFGYIDGDDSPFEEPTNAEELIIPPNVSISFDFYNPDPSTAYEPLLNIKMRTYNIRALNVNDGPDRNAIRNIVQPGSPMPIYPAGGLDNKVRYNLQDAWEVDVLRKDELMAIKNGNYRGGR